jgi:hypothetical protein
MTAVLTLVAATAIGERAVRAQGLAELNLIPVAVSPASVAVPPSGAAFDVTVEIQVSTFDFAPDALLHLIGDDINSAVWDELDPSSWDCPASVPAGSTGTCTVTLHAAGGAVSASETHRVIIADVPQGIGGTTDPITVTYSDEPSYDPGPLGTVSWTQPSGAVGVDVTTEDGGVITISGSGGASQYEVIGQVMEISAPDACSPAAPSELVFRIDATEAANQDPVVTELNAVVWRNGSPVPECPSPEPPCVSQRSSPGGVITLKVTADQVSNWMVAQPRPEDCRQGGWRALPDADGQPFPNLAACVKSMAHRR